MSPSSFPPGLIFLAHTIPKISLPLLPILIAHRTLPYHLPGYAWIFAYALAAPAMLVFKGSLRHFRQEREIKKLGARRVPQVPSYWPGGVDIMLKAIKAFTVGYLGSLWGEWSPAFGHTFNLSICFQDQILTADPENIKAMLATDFDRYEKGPQLKAYFQSVLGDGMFNSDDDTWKFHRAMTRPFFARDRVTDFELFDRHAEVVVRQLKERFAQGEAIDFQDLMGRFTLDTATEFLFGSCVHSLSADLPYGGNSPRRDTICRPHPSNRFVVAFKEAQIHIARRPRLASAWRLAEFWKDKAQEPMKIIYDYVEPILRNALANKGKAEKTSSMGMDNGHVETLLDHLVEQTDDLVVIRDEIVNFMIAGRDPTMATLTFAVYCLSQSPNVLEKLRHEILTKIPSNNFPTFDEMKECKYLRAVINETLRLYPPLPFNTRRCKQSMTWAAPDGGKPFYIPAGTELPYCTWVMQRRTDLWGPDAETFDPDRFLDERLHKYLIPNPSIFMPFSAGPRICLGQQFAYHEASFMLIRLLQTFDTIALASEAQPADSHPPASWKLAPGRQATEKIWPKMSINLYAYKGLWLRMREAQSSDTV